MPSNDKPWLVWLALMLALPVSAQTTEGTLVDLVRAVKAQKEAALDPARAQRQQTQQIVQSQTNSTPLVWSITGLNHDYTALLVHDGQVQRVRTADLPFGLGVWRVVAVDSTGVLLHRAGQQMHLPAPDAGTRPETYMTQLGAAAGLPAAIAQPAELAQRLPAGMSAQPVLPPAPLTPAQMRASSLQAPAPGSAQRP